MMNKLVWPLAAIVVAAIIATGGVLAARSYGHATAAPPARRVAVTRQVQSPAPVPTVTKTVVRRVRIPVAVPAPNVTDPWAVVSAYYGDVESRNYPEAWALLSSGEVTGQTYGQFVAGYACTGYEDVTELGESGDRVSFNLTAVDDCTGKTQYYSGTDTVIGGKIVGAQITQTG